MPVDERTRLCFQAQRSVDPNVPQQDALRTGCDMYDNLRQLFIGIQVAGPRLGPTSIDRASTPSPPSRARTSTIPACYYLPGDYTCVKDYDPRCAGTTGRRREDGPAPSCYERRRNRRPDRQQHATASDPMTEHRLRDPCLNFGSGLQPNIAPPDPNEL